MNPTLFEVDLKIFFYQPSLIGFMLLIFAFVEYNITNYSIHPP